MTEAKPLVIILIIVNILALIFSGILAYAWYQGVLTQFIDLHHSFTGDVPMTMMVASFFAKYTGYLTTFYTVIFLVSAFLKSRVGLIVSFLLTAWQIVVMLYVMYGNLITMS